MKRAASSSRLVIVAARAPFVAGPAGLTRAPGGLVSALLPLVRRTRGAWIAAGCDHDASEASELSFRVRALVIDPETRARWYAGACNGALWPLAHGFLERCHFRAQEFGAYLDVNRAAAEAADAMAPPQGTVWVHDYQLGLVPALLRARRPDLRIGFFWHIPWPAAEWLRVLPWAQELLHGVLGADLVGFHVPRYVRALRDMLVELGVPHVDDGEGIVARTDARTTRIEPHPIGVEVERWARLARDEDVQREADALRASLGAERVLLAVDRLDYAKGIVERLEAFERMLERSPEARARVTLVQIGVPSRESCHGYRELRSRVEAAVGRIQGRFGAPGRAPVHLLEHSFAPRELAVYYAAADAALVTPMRDGMNLVAFEYVAARPRPSGRLLLSTTAGAADVLVEAHVVNPYDADGLSRAIEDVALAPETPTDAARMAALQARVAAMPVDAWVDRFLARLGEDVEPPRVAVQGRAARRGPAAGG
jgi:trehalose 6-phosphate synthase